MAGKGWKWLEIAGNCWNVLEMALMGGNGYNGCKGLEMAKKKCKHGQTQVEMARHGCKWAVNGWNWMTMAGMA